MRYIFKKFYLLWIDPPQRVAQYPSLVAKHFLYIVQIPEILPKPKP